jgi:DNA ligase-1
MNKLLQIIVDISNAKGTKAKSKILENVANGKTCNTTTDCERLKVLLKTAFDPFVITHINKINIGSSLDPVHLIDDKVEVSFKEFVALVNKLVSVKAMNNDLRSEVELFCKRVQDKEQREVLVKIFTKSLNIGVSTSSINKVFPNLIFDRSLMLASKDMSVVKEWNPADTIINVKYDGIRLVAYHAKDAIDFQFFTRSFNKINSAYLKTIEDQLKLIFLDNGNQYKKTFFVDGELTSKDRLSVSGDLNRMLRETYTGTGDNLIYNIFDLVESDAIVENDPKHVDQRQYYERKKTLEILYKAVDKPANVVFAEEYKIKSFDEIQGIYDKMRKRGEEGVIVKNLTSIYEFDRSENWVKIKAVETADLLIKAINIGAAGTKLANTCGAILCETADGQLSVNVGGLDDATRDLLWKNQKKYLGTICEVFYNAIIKDKQGGNSLFLPRFAQFRVDKLEANSFKELK